MSRRYQRWTPEEDDALFKYGRDHNNRWEGWAELLPGRTDHQIRDRKARLGIRLAATGHERHVWTPDEDAVLREHSATRPPSWEGWTDLLPGLTLKQIQARRTTLGLRLEPKAKRPVHKRHAAKEWTDAQRVALVGAATKAVEASGHSLGECAVELARLVREHKSKEG